MASETTTWLDALKVGDEVLVAFHQDGYIEEVLPITMVTPSYIYVAYTRNGKRRARAFYRYSGLQHPPRKSRMQDDSILRRVPQQQARDRKARIKHITDALPTLSQSQLERVAAIVDEGEEGKTE